MNMSMEIDTAPRQTTPRFFESICAFFRRPLESLRAKVRSGSANNTLFHNILLLLGVRCCGQSLYSVDAGPFVIVRSWLQPFRIFTFVVFGSLCVLPVHYASTLSTDYSDKAAIMFFSEVFLPIQYFLSVLYFGSDHIQLFYDVVRPVPVRTRSPDTGRHTPLGERARKLSHIREIFVDIRSENGLHFDSLIKHPCRITINVAASLVLVVLVSTLVGSLFTSPFHPSEWLFTFFVCGRLFGRGACVVNTVAFAFIFYKHVKVLDVYAQTLEHQDWTGQNYDKVSVMLLNVTRMRESLKIATEATKSMFSSGTIAGVIVLGALIHSTTLSHETLTSYDTILIMSSFVVLQGLIFSVIARLSCAKKRISDVTKSAKFATKFLARQAGDNVAMSAFETASTLDYCIFTDIINEQWLDFSVMGIPVHSMAFLKQVASFMSVLLVLANTGNVQITT